MLATVRYLTRVGRGGGALPSDVVGRPSHHGGWVSLFEENTSGALGGATDTTLNDNCDRFPPPPTMFYLPTCLLECSIHAERVKIN